MTNQEIIERQKMLKRWYSTELGSLFEKFVSLHARACQLDERHGLSRSAEKAWKDLESVEVELRDKLMKIAGVRE